MTSNVQVMMETIELKVPFLGTVLLSRKFSMIWMFPKSRGKPPKWMVKIMEKHIKMDDLEGFTPIFRNTHIGYIGFPSLPRLDAKHLEFAQDATEMLLEPSESHECFDNSLALGRRLASRSSAKHLLAKARGSWLPCSSAKHHGFIGLFMCAMVKSRYIGDGRPPTFYRNPYNGYINLYYWVDDHPLLYGNNGSLDPGTCYVGRIWCSSW